MFIKALVMIIPVILFSDTGILIKVVDGDTLNFKTNNKIVKCRIVNIDTPESSNNSKNKRDTKNCKVVSNKDMVSAGKSAARAAKRLLTLNKQYEYEVSGKDRYKRSLCVVKLEDTTFNEQIVLDGYAVPYRQYLSGSELHHYNSLLSEARENRVGLWKDRREVIECLNQVRN